MKREIGWATVGSITFALCFSYGILAHLTRGDISSYPQNDWDYFLQLRWVPYYTITHFHQFPLWNPYKCGGMPILGNPQASLFTPFLLLDLLFGPIVGARLQIIAHLAIGFGGAYFLGRVFRISKLGSIACAITFAGSSWYYLRAEVGHLTFMTGAYSPWVIALLQLSSVRRRLTPAALGGLLMALMLLEGGAHLFLQLALLLALLAPMLALQQKSLYPLFAAATMAAFMVGFALIELLPGLAYTGRYGRTSGPEEFTELSLMFRSLFSRNQSPINGFYEQGAYIGVLFAGLAVYGSILRFRRAFPWIILFVATFALAAGYFWPYAPWVLTHRLPFYDSERGPYRWLIVIPLITGVLAGFGIDAMRATGRSWGAIFAALLVGLAFADDWLVATPYLHMVVDGQEAPQSRWPAFRQVVDNQYGLSMFAAAKANMGVASCYEVRGVMPHTHVRGFNQPDYRGEAYLSNAGALRFSQWTPNEWTFEVESAVPSAIVVNQNFDPGWRVAQGEGNISSNADGLIEVEIPAGKQHLVLTYHSKEFLIGLLCATGTVVALILLWGYERRRLVKASTERSQPG